MYGPSLERNNSEVLGFVCKTQHASSERKANMKLHEGCSVKAKQGCGDTGLGHLGVGQLMLTG